MNPTPHRPSARVSLLPGLVLALLLAGGAVLSAVETPDGQKVTAPVPLKRILPVHPLEMQKKLLNGQAVAECLVTETGELRDARVLSASAPEFGEAAVEALRQWEFRPGEIDGKPASMRLQVPFEFRLTLEQIIESALQRKVFEEITDLIVPAQQLPSWPRPIQFLLPKYPESLKGSGKYGKAVVSVIINKEGKVMNPVILKSSYPEFVLPALAAAARLEFPPQVMANGIHINVSMDMQFDFKPDTTKPVKPGTKETPKPKEKPKSS